MERNEGAGGVEEGGKPREWTLRGFAYLDVVQPGVTAGPKLALRETVRVREVVEAPAPSPVAGPRPMKLRAIILQDRTFVIQKRYKEGWYPLLERYGLEPEDMGEISDRINAFETSASESRSEAEGNKTQSRPAGELS